MTGTIWDRRLIGAVVLSVATVGLVVVSQAAGNRLAGNPIADWPQPPAVGSCLDLDDDTGSRAVPCDRPHDAEVMKTFDALDPIAAATSADSQLTVTDACDAAADAISQADSAPPAGESVLPGQPDWALPLSALLVRLVHAPPDQRAGPYGWMACVVQPGVPVRYTGTFRGATANNRPAAYGTCYDDRGTAVSCLAPHATEVLAVVARQIIVGKPARTPDRSRSPVSAPISDADIAAAQEAVDAQNAATRKLASTLPTWTKQCQNIAVSRLGVDDPTYDGALLVTVPPDMEAATHQLDASATPGSNGSDFNLQGQCIVKATDGSLLTDSIIGWGNKPPPLTAQR
jgi:hypothetical protein